jgi:hypothetical protein
VSTVLDGGTHPVASHFLATQDQPEATHAMVLGQCGSCGLIQLTQGAPATALVAPFTWVSYNEPEGHLGTLAQVLRSLPGVTLAWAIGGISFKDDSTLARLKALGFSNVRRLEPEADLEITDPRAGLETIQAQLDAKRGAALAQRDGAFDVLIARHIVEHAHDVLTFVGGLKSLLRPGGYLVIEVPDCTSMLEICDYTMLWEEHVAYFTPATLRGLFAPLGLELDRLMIYPGHSLVAIAQVADGIDQQATPDPSVVRDELALASIYGAGLQSRREAVTTAIAAAVADGKRVAMFGAGHMACMFIDLMGIADGIDCVIDDHPEKVGMFLPGSRLPIVASTELADLTLGLCLMSLSPESEAKVIAKHRAFEARGGVFASIFPSSKRALSDAGTERSVAQNTTS